MRKLRPGDNPRKVFSKSHRERGPAKLFTFDDLAAAAVEAPATTRSRLRTSTDARQAALYIINALARRSTKLVDDAAAASVGLSLVQWRQRWPRFELFGCGFPDCKKSLLQPGLCQDHGGPLRPFALVDDDHVMLWTGSEYTPICHVMLNVPDTQRVEHLDGNTWNNRPMNLRGPEDIVAAQRTRWSYGYAELASLFGLSEASTRKAVSRGAVRPNMLKDVHAFATLRERRR